MRCGALGQSRVRLRQGGCSILYAHAIRPEFIFHLRWRANDLAIWDNHCAMHYAADD